MPLADRTPDVPQQPVPERSPVAPRADDPKVQAQLDSLIQHMLGSQSTNGAFSPRLVKDLMTNALKLIADEREGYVGPGDLKLMTNSFKEMRYAYRLFGKYKDPHKITIFGSARTPEDHPDYAACVEFSKLMANAGWMSITGAGLGIMKAGHVGPGREASFGVAIRLPFETSANPVIAGDEKLINFRYFFTRKLMFVSQAEAVALFPGGFGTLDEAFETLTLVQTGRSTPMPIVCVEGSHTGTGRADQPNGSSSYWHSWDQWIKEQLLARKWISPEDPSIYYIAKDAKDAADHVLQFYRIYHSSRYVKDDFVIRLKKPLKPELVEQLEQEFKVLIKTGSMTQRIANNPLEGEADNLDLPRLVFTHTKHKYGLIRRLIDRINELG